MNEQTEQTVSYVSPLKKICMTIGAIPSSYLETMTYYEMLVWFTNFLRETVIPTVNNNAEAVEELQGLYEDLRQYVNEYFDNLDVQQEIDNKLEDMARTGELTELIKAYVDPIYQEFETEINNDIAYYNSWVSNELHMQNETIGTIDRKVNSAVNKNPIPVSSTSDMTNTSAIYLNTTDGYWYYYDGTNWVQGGEYLTNQTPITEEILRQLKLNREFLTTDEVTVPLILNYVDFEIGGISSSTGAEVSNNTTVRTADYMNFDETVKLLTNNLTTFQYCQIFMYKSDGTFIRYYDLNSLTKFPYTCHGMKYKLLLGIGSTVTDIQTVVESFSFSLLAKIKKDDNVFITEEANLINPNQVWNGYTIVQSGYMYNSNSADFGVVIVEIDNTKNYYSDRPGYYTSFYDEDFNVISVHGGGMSSPALTNPINPPDNAKYMGITKDLNRIGSSAYLSTENQYYPYGKKFNSVKSDIIDDDKPVLTKDLDYEAKLKDKKILFIGDSITSTDYTTPNYWQIIASKTGAICEANAVSGTSLAHTDLRHCYGGLDPEEIGYIPSDPSTWLTGNCICERIGRITNDDYDAVVVMGGSNDLYCGKGTWDDTDIHRLYGAMNFILDNLTVKFPSDKILVCTPIQKATTYQQNVFDPTSALASTTVGADLPLQLLSEGIKQKCQQYGIPCVDLFNTSGINGADTNKVYYRPNDPLHPSALGEERIASIIIDELIRLFS